MQSSHIYNLEQAQAIMAVIAALDQEAALVLARIRGLLG
jgi:hypothetical protein